jgi:glutathione S-transferase
MPMQRLLEELGAKYELLLVDRTKCSEIQGLEINPNGRIPTLVDKSLVLSETAAIVLHLVDQHPDAGLRD